MIALGFLAALFFIKRDAARSGIDVAVVTDMTFWGLLIGIAGTRLLHIIMFPDYYSWRDPVGWIALWRGGLVFQGGPPLVAVFCYFYLRHYKQPIWKTADIIFPYVALGHAFGRMGCFLKGCCYGARTDLPWGVRFPRVPADLSVYPTDSPAFLDHARSYPEVSISSDLWSLPVHPTQLYSVVALIALCLVLLLLRKKWHPFYGFTMPVYFVFYSTYRFFVEFVRADHNPNHFGDSFSDQQVFCLVTIVVGILMFFVMKKYCSPYPENSSNTE